MFAIDPVEAFPPRYNIAPTQPVLAIMAGEGNMSHERANQPNRHAMLMRWGLLPGWVKDPKDFPLLINARSETAAQKPSFRAAMRHRRCIIPASGFFEWQRDKATATSQAWWVPRSDRGLAAFAGLSETWSAADGSQIDTCAILTTQATQPFAAIHDRMPVMIGENDLTRWLDCRNHTPADVADLLIAPADGLLQPVPVSDSVNKVANTDPAIIAPVEPKPGFGLDPRRDDASAGQDGNGQGFLF